jgi:hypothetical protein
VSRLVRAGSVVRVPYSDMGLQSSGIDFVGGLLVCVVDFLYCGHLVLLMVLLWLLRCREGKRKIDLRRERWACVEVCQRRA